MPYSGPRLAQARKVGALVQPAPDLGRRVHSQTFGHWTLRLPRCIGDLRWSGGVYRVQGDYITRVAGRQCWPGHEGSTTWSAETRIALSTVEGSPEGLAMLWEPALVAADGRVCAAVPVYGAGLRAYCSPDGGVTWVQGDITTTANNAHGLVLAADAGGTYRAWQDRRDDDWEVYFAEERRPYQVYLPLVSKE